MAVVLLVCPLVRCAALLPSSPSPPLMTETQERFLRAVLTRVPLDSVVEMHLFPPIRRGTLETGVAVIATALPREPLIVVTDEDGTVESAGAPVIMLSEAMPSHDASAQEIPAEDSVATDVDATATPVESETPVRALVSVDIGEALMDVEGTADDEPQATPSVPSPRMRIFTASYRHTIKGVERGKWTFDVHEEADAPLEAVELVLRGVRHRSTEPADPEQVSHDALTALVTPARVAPAA